MSNVQRWFLVIAIWIIAFAILLGAFKGRYRFTSLDNPVYKGGRFDTWTGEVEVRQWDEKKSKWIWAGYTPNLVKDVK